MSISHTSLSLGIALLLPFTAAWGVLAPTDLTVSTYAVVAALVLAILIIAHTAWKNGQVTEGVGRVSEPAAALSRDRSV